MEKISMEVWEKCTFKGLEKNFFFRNVYFSNAKNKQKSFLYNQKKLDWQQKFTANFWKTSYCFSEE